YYQGGKERVESLFKKHGVTLGANTSAPGCLTLGWEYDYAYPFMTDQERAIVRRVIAKITHGKFTTGMAIPGQMYINNHMSGSANQICLALAIEGEEGYDPRIAKMAEWSLTNKLSYDLSSDGITYENTKGFIPMLPVLAIARRQGADHPKNLLKHSHLLARANSNLQNARKVYYRYDGAWRRRPDSKRMDEIITGLDEERYWRASGGSGSGGHLEFWSVLKHFYPDNEMVDFVWNCKLPGSLSYYEGKPHENWHGKIHHWWFILKAINLLTATHETDYNKQSELVQFKDVQKFWFDRERGMMAARNGWGEDSMLVHMENRTDQYYMGHESPQHGDFQIWANGIPWVNNGGAYLDTSFRNMVLVDGLAGVYAPVSGDWMTATNTPEAATSVAEMTTAYRWRKSMNGLRHLDHPGLEQMPSQMGRFANDAYKLNRFTELPYLPRIQEHYDGFAHLDYGPWHGETRGPERYIKWNDPMDHVFRALHLARGDKPYLLVMDDLRKADDKPHQFDWRMMITGDAVVYSSNPAARGRHIEMNTDGVIGTDLLFCLAGDRLRRRRGNAWWLMYVEMKPSPQKGDPMLLVRVLWRRTRFPYPVPNVQRSFSWNMVSVPAFGKSPEYRVMIFPHRFGDKLPVTEWSDDRTRLTVKVGSNIDIYDFDQTDRERTVFRMTRNGKPVTDSAARPPRPQLVERTSFTIDQNRPDWRAPRVISGPVQVRFVAGKPGSQIHYTLDGSEPGSNSPAYARPFTIDRSCTLKARMWQPFWHFGKENWSETVSFDFEIQNPRPPVTVAGAATGLLVKGYEIRTTLFDKKGFFQGSKKSLPDVRNFQPLVTTATPRFDIPVMQSREPRKRMMKGFYQFQGYFDAPETGV
ncbi:MAG: chitobiase/beta-hexosaminidase C-terminal domain-containing protein, partial [Planctomycetota bacterium]|nr:chitobiase/beta-hexosaminidase C-terminal domain-containing protein [Planctomycetota bacterium]